MRNGGERRSLRGAVAFWKELEEEEEPENWSVQ